MKLMKKKQMKESDTAELIFTTRVNVDLKYEPFWCMIETFAVNMPSTEEKLSFQFYAFVFFASPPDPFSLARPLTTCLL